MARSTKPKPKKMGRPRLPNGTAKGRIVPVRFSQAELERISTAASLSNQKLSEWIRSTLNAATA
jgi:hypothetical protein